MSYLTDLAYSDRLALPSIERRAVLDALEDDELTLIAICQETNLTRPPVRRALLSLIREGAIAEHQIGSDAASYVTIYERL